MNKTRKKINILSEITQTQKDEHTIYTLISGYQMQIKG